MMEKYIPYEKLSKKEKRKLDICRRKTWGNLNPVTRKPANSKVYNRKKNCQLEREALLVELTERGSGESETLV